MDAEPSSDSAAAAAVNNECLLEPSCSDDDDSGGVSGEGASPASSASAPLNQGPSADWTPDALATAHIFVPTSSSHDACYLSNESECRNAGGRMKCVACHIICHEGCIITLSEKFHCRATFNKDCVRKYREHTAVEHHWVQRKQLKGKCKHCGKAFQSKLGFGSSRSELVGWNCSWCKYSYHSKDNCLKAKEKDTDCDLGTHKEVTVPPSWIVKVPRKGSFKSSLKSSPNKNKRRGGQKRDVSAATAAANAAAAATASSASLTPPSGRPFCIKPIPSPITPLLVFLNPKSGGNQGAKLMQKFQWLLNPRQVFDLTKGGPQPAIEMFRKVPNVKLLACGGDGTVGWLLSVLDKVKVEPQPAVSVLPLGTGNDLSRSLGWGGGYIDEPISKIIGGLQSADEVQMDRWVLKVARNTDFPSTDKGHDDLPLNVVNNYFSFGVDAQIALQFHEAREANPQKFNSRIRNKMFYGQAGGKDLLLRKWKDLSDEVTVECDGQDITPKLKEHRVHSVLFANIPNFGSGTRPWNNAAGEQRIDDGLIEVIGLTTYQLPMLQAGAHGMCITQCKSAKISTRKTIPMQVDGEAIRLNPAEIELTFLNQVKMLSKRKGHHSSSGRSNAAEQPSTSLMLKVSRISMDDYATHYNNKDKLKELAKACGEISTASDADLDQVRKLINQLLEGNQASSAAGSATTAQQQDWCFVDTVTALRFFRIDKAQENLHYVLDICDDSGIYVLFEEEEDNDTEEAAEPAAEVATLEPGDHAMPSVEGSPARGEVNGNRDEEEEAKDKFVGLGTSAVTAGMAAVANETNNNLIQSEHPMDQQVELQQQQPNIQLLEQDQQQPQSQSPNPSPVINPLLEKTTEGILKAARLGDLKMLAELHHEGYSLLSIDETGKTALHYGARFGHKEIIRFLIAKAPASILDMVDNEKGQTALHKAAGYKRRTICCTLVAAGASLLIKDHAGFTPRQLSQMAEDIDLASYLESQEEFQLDKLAGEDPAETPV